MGVRNTGKVAGKEPVLLFCSDFYASLTPDVCRLRDYKKIELAPGQSQTVEFCINASDLSYAGEDLNWVLETGEFRFACGDHSVIVNCISGK